MNANPGSSRAEWYGRDPQISPAENVVSCELDGGRALLDLEKSQYYSLNDTAATIWEWLEADTNKPSELVEKMQATYEVELEQCQADLAAILSSLLDAGLIREKSDGAS